MAIASSSTFAPRSRRSSSPSGSTTSNSSRCRPTRAHSCSTCRRALFNRRATLRGTPLAVTSRMRKELKKLYEMIEELDTAMLTTRRADGHLVSRAMANQKHAPGADLWFVTTEASGKLDDLAADPHINLAYYKDRTREWVSVAGLAKVSRDRDTI